MEQLLLSPVFFSLPLPITRPCADQLCVVIALMYGVSSFHVLSIISCLADGMQRLMADGWLIKLNVAKCSFISTCLLISLSFSVRT